MRKLYLILLLLLPLLAQAQSKVNASTAIWPEWQITSGIGGSEAHLLFLRNSYRINTNSDFNDLKESGVLSNFERVELSVGYENTLTDHWRAGLILRYAAENYPTTVFVSPFLRHNGSIKSLYFNKQLTFDYVKQEDVDAFGRFRLMAELGKRLPVGTRYLTPSVSYEVLL
ncbi:MAG: hypothetical protein LPK03_00795, partial [Pontibacter sp.]|nr:hypothetical protein [Pontibacter sp.]